MLPLIAALLILNFFGLVAVVVAVRNVEDAVKMNNLTLGQIESLQRNPRTRMAQAHMQSGPETQEQQLTKLGRASVGRRSVVGGDPDSQLNTDLQSRIDEEEANRE